MHNNAVGDAPGELLIGWSPELGNPGGTWLLPQKELQDAFVNNGSASTQVTTVVMLDDIIGSSPVDMIKIDVEGAEPLALAGAMNVLRNQRPTVLCEINPRLLQTVSNTDEETFVRRLEDVGYDCRLLTPQGEVGLPFWRRSEVADYDMINVVFVPAG